MQRHFLMAIDTQVSYYLSLYGKAIGTGLIIIALLSAAGSAYVYTNPPVEETPPEEFAVQSFSMDTAHSATVTRSTPLYEEGEVLTNHPVYFRNSTPNLRLSTTVTVPGDRNVTITQRTFVRYEASFNGESFWSRERLLAAADRTVEGDQLRINTTLEIPEVSQEQSEFGNALGSVGSLSTDLVITLRYESPAEGGETYTGRLQTGSPIQLTGDAYYLQGGLSASDTQSQTRGGGTQVGSPNMTQVGLLLGVSGVLIVLGGGVIVWSARQEDTRELELAVYREQYSQWISEGEFPAGSERNYIYIDSLKGLVDIAIDTNNRVIYDSDIEVYSIVDEGVVYYHSPDPTVISSWIDFSPE